MQARLVITAIETECITQAVIDEITSALGTTVRVEVRADGSTFTEVAVATPPTPTPAAADQLSRVRLSGRAVESVLKENLNHG